MRRRILCLVLLALLMAPAAGWTKGAVIDPDGTPASGEAEAVEPVASVDGASVDAAPSSSSLWELLARWLEAKGALL